MIRNTPLRSGGKVAPHFTRWGLFFLLALCVFAATPARAQSAHVYSLLFDTDGNGSTGCAATLADGGGALSTGGWEYRVSVSVGADGMVGVPGISACSGGAFGTESPAGSAPHPLDSGRDLRSEDRIEFGLPLAALGNPAAFTLALSSSGDYLARGADGSPLRGPAPHGPTGPTGPTGPGAAGTTHAIPTLAPGSLLLLAAALGWLARRRLRHSLTLAAVFTAAGLLAATLAWAVAIVFDGSIADWSGVTPLAADPADDHIPGAPDLLALFLVKEGPTLAVRIDAATGRNRAPVIDTAAHSATATVGQPWNASFTATDPDRDPLVWTLTSAPAGMNITGSATDASSGSATGHIAAWTPAATGAHTFTVRVADPGGASADRSVTLTVAADPGSDPGPAPAPAFTSTAPTSATAGVPWSYTPALTPASGLTLALASGPAGMTLTGGVLSFTPTAPGSYPVTLTATDSLSRQATHSFTLTVAPAAPGGAGPDFEPLSHADHPRFSNLTPQTLTAGVPWSFAAVAQNSSGAPLAVALQPGQSLPAGLGVTPGAPLTLAWTPPANQAGVHAVTLVSTDAAGRATTQTLLLAVTAPGLPADPAARATPLLPGGLTPFDEATAFLYTGSDPIQRGVAPGAIDPERAIVLRGRVLDRAGDPLPGVTVTVPGHPEYGHTLTRADGWFDLAANGGGLLTVDYRKAGYFSAQRKLDTPWRDYAIVDDVVLIPPSPRATPIQTGAAGWQAGVGELETDADGARRATVLFPPGTQARLRFPDGSTRALDALTFRATEYTVGDNGPQTMPGALPLSVGYTYAVDLSADEALAAGAQVEFDRALPFYVDNFIGFPVGTAVPAGWYDPARAAWIGSDNGRVIRILDTVGGKATLQVTEEARPATAAELIELGITDGELQALAQRYPGAAGHTLWRTPITHFTPWDCNWPYGPPVDADAPPPVQDKEECQLGQKCCPALGCEIHAEARALGQRIAIPGSPFDLHYRSDRAGSATRSVPLTEPSRPVPESLKRVEAWIDIAGRRIVHEIPRALLAPGHAWSFTWDGRDAYGRAVYTGAGATITVRHAYPAVYYPVAAAQTGAFAAVIARAGSAGSTGGLAFERSSSEVFVLRTHKAFLTPPQGSPEAALTDAGGWTLAGLRFYDASRKMLHTGGGASQKGVSQIAGAFRPLLDGNHMPLNLAGGVGGAVTHAIASDDGAIYASLGSGNHRILRITRNGAWSVFAGTGAAASGGDGGPAVSAHLASPGALATGPDGSLYVIDLSGMRIRRIAPDGIIHTVAGNVFTGTENVVGPALATRIQARTLAVDRDANIFFAPSSGSRLYMISTGGMLSAVGNFGANIRALAADPAGGVWVATANRIWRVDGGGAAIPVAGGGAQTGDGSGPLLAVSPGTLLLPDRAGGVYFDEPGRTRVRHLAAGGAVASLDEAFYHDPDTPTVRLPDGQIWQIRGNTLGKLDAGFPPYGGAGGYTLPRENGLILDVFDRYGRPAAVRNGVTETDIQTFGYDGERLAHVTDADGNTTTFERDGMGRLSAITGPDGERSTLGYDGAGRLATVTTPGGLTHSMTYGPAFDPARRHLLATYADPNGHLDRFDYDEAGRLVQNRDPAGGGWTLSGTVTDVSTAWSPGARFITTTLTSAEGRQTRYESRIDSKNTQKVTAPDGLVTRWESATGYGATTLWTKTLPDGARIYGSLTPDPRWGMLAATRQTETLFAPGLTQTETRQHSLGYTDSLGNQWTQTTRTGDAAWRTRYSAYEGAVETFSPTGPVSYALVDEQLRPEYLSITGLDAYAGFERDPRGRLTGTRLHAYGASSETRATAYAYHDTAPGKGQLARITDPLGRSTTFDYDDAGRLIRSTGPDGRTLQAARDANGNMTSLTTPAGITHHFTWDAVNQPAAYTAPDSATPASTTWHYNLDRELARITRPGGQTLELTRDAGGRLSALTLTAPGQPDATTTYGYNALGQLITESAAGVTLTHHYTGSLPHEQRWTGEITGAYSRTLQSRFERILSPSFTLEAGGQTLTLPTAADPAGRPTRAGNLHLAYTPAGQPASLTLGQTATTHAYNGFGEPLHTRHSGPIGFLIPSAEALRTRLLALSGALHATLTEQVQTQGSCQRSGWDSGEDSDDRWRYADEVEGEEYGWYLATYGEPQPRAPDWCLEWLGKRFTSLASDLNYAAPGNSGADFARSGISHIRNHASGGAAAISAMIDRPGYAPLPDATSFVTPEAQALFDEIAALINDFQAESSYVAFITESRYERDALGRLTRQHGAFLGTAFDVRYEYTPGGHLAAVEDNGARTEWQYDANGNRTHENGVLIATVDSEDRLQGFKGNTYTYTPAGELHTKHNAAGTTTYGYDALGNLRNASLPGGAQIEYLIDPRNRRIGKKKNGLLQYGLLYQDGLRPVAQLNPDNTIRAVFLYGDQPNAPAAMLRDGKTYRFITDHLGSVRAVINAETGEIAQRMDYDVWGRVTNDTSPHFQPFGFAGGLYDPDTGLTRFGARDYDAQTGRWTAKDPILFAGGDSNLYGYVSNDPVNFIDPEGLWAWGDSIPQGLVDACAGFGDGVSLGITAGIRELMGTNGAVDMSSQEYMAGAIAGVAVTTRGYVTGAELRIGRNFRLAPWGNRTGHPVGEYPHYHRRGASDASGNTIPGQGISRHRPWEKKPSDKCNCNRF